MHILASFCFSNNWEIKQGLKNWAKGRLILGPGTPDIICGPDRIGVRASTKEPFDGYVFVMDHFHDKANYRWCMRKKHMSFRTAERVQRVSTMHEVLDWRFHFRVAMCIDIDRWAVSQRKATDYTVFQLNPKGIFVEVTFVFMFHQLFMTKSDQMIKLQCFYMEAQKPVTVPLSVR